MKRLIALFLFLLATAATDAASTDIPIVDRTVIQRCVIDGPSARMIAVGFPGGFNYAFDAQNCAPVYVWSGGFVDFSGETLGRGGRKCEILGIKRPLETPINPLRLNNPDTLPESLVFKGYRRNHNSGRPTFLYEVDGTPVEQSLESSSANIVRINLRFAGSDPIEKFYHLDASKHTQVALSEGLRWRSPGVVSIPAGIEKATLTLTLAPLEKAYVRKEQQLSGAQIYSYYCKACHSNDGTKLIGPTFKGLWGRSQVLTREGKNDTVTIDAPYIRESITQPQAAIVKGYEAVPMPSFATLLSDQDIEALIDYIKAPQ